MAQPMTWEQLAPALPPPGCAGIVVAAALAEGMVKRVLSDPRLVIKPREEWPEDLPTARVHCSRAEWRKIAP